MLLKASREQLVELGADALLYRIRVRYVSKDLQDIMLKAVAWAAEVDQAHRFNLHTHSCISDLSSSAKVPRRH